MEEMDHRSTPGAQSRKFPAGNPTKRGRVLRATDVIPPFNQNAQPPQDGAEIPSYDLAENILAEQRRAAGRRRRGPGRVEPEPAGLAPVGATHASPVQDLSELQHVVAEIVARDIERLCRRPERPACVALS